MRDNHFYAVCVTTGHDASKAQEFFDILDEQFRADYIPWKKSIAVSVGVDNTSSVIVRIHLHLGVDREIHIFL